MKLTTRLNGAVYDLYRDSFTFVLVGHLHNLKIQGGNACKTVRLLAVEGNRISLILLKVQHGRCLK